GAPPAAAPVPPAALRPLPGDVSDAELAHRVREDPSSLGPMSVGEPSSGALVNGVQLRAGRGHELVDPANSWGTQETIEYLTRCIDAVQSRFPGTPKMQIGHLSARRGGHLSPHKSHQSGRDVDVSYYLRGSPRRWYRRATEDGLDRPRSWAFVRAVLTETDVQYVFMNTSVQKLLKEYAFQIGEDPAWLDDVFQYQSHAGAPIIRHAPGHDTHIHVRFFSPVAQELGRRAYPLLVEQGKIAAPVRYALHKAKSGDTLGSLANRYETTVKAIQEANGLRSNRIYAKRIYRIPQRGQAEIRTAPVRIPPRRLPPPGTPREPPSASASLIY
ncbi:MAG: penicillin-insensitive murein endopeptidase, partial [Deltaproteobacteria bacterium]|nr:penicillin-insensitive murein endopeptidase [Deltaproteobacteria bacterium]